MTQNLFLTKTFFIKFFYLGVPLANTRVGLLRAIVGSGDIVNHAMRVLRQSPRFARGSAGFAALRIPHAIFGNFSLHYLY
jgi:hypothetical protein